MVPYITGARSRWRHDIDTLSVLLDTLRGASTVPFFIVRVENTLNK